MPGIHLPDIKIPIDSAKSAEHLLDQCHRRLKFLDKRPTLSIFKLEIHLRDNIPRR